jgi:hypothetical protein
MSLITGPVTITVTSGNAAALRDAVSRFLCDHNDDPDADSATIHLSDVSDLDTASLIEADPDAVWFAACSPDCNPPNTLHMYADRQLLTRHHIDGHLVMPPELVTTCWGDQAVRKWNRARGHLSTPRKAGTRQ